ncbi:MAG: hypothetical protein FD176_2127 [Rhodospirillaceae bacterium]|nr:MAG: hypothetical protein FD176_2127 [Rhodospirillaceae bacterium]TNC96901.1 MAG: hypothetical protein FD119_1407 [Stygiobacter sp.]
MDPPLIMTRSEVEEGLFRVGSENPPLAGTGLFLCLPLE